ncbi:MAG: HEAT repeat domain-containing protein [Chloroflexi bacterium]|nr:HEAT repeat domain-containing protein [Chloroflexota bacterium]
MRIGLVAIIGVAAMAMIGMAIAADEGKVEQPPGMTLEESVGRLGRLKPGAESDQVIADLARQGEKALVEIEQQLVERDVDYGWRHNAVRVLRALNTEESRTLLRRMALGELSGGNPNLAAWAAQALLACDSHEAWALLASASPRTLATTLKALDGQQVDEKYMPLLKKYLHNKDLSVCRSAADVMANDPTGKFADETVDAIADALTSIARQRDVNAPYPRAGGYTVGEMYYLPFIGALERVRIDNEALWRLTKRVQGRAKDAVLLALARRGDRSAREEVVQLVHDSQAGAFRIWATRTLGKIGGSGDLAMLRTLAATDPLVREGDLPAPHPLGSRGPTYPVRIAAKSAIRAIEKRERERSER